MPNKQELKLEMLHMEVADVTNIYAARSELGFNRTTGRMNTEVVWHRFGNTPPAFVAPCGFDSSQAVLPKRRDPVKLLCDMGCSITQAEVDAANKILGY